MQFQRSILTAFSVSFVFGLADAQAFSRSWFDDEEVDQQNSANQVASGNCDLTQPQAFLRVIGIDVTDQDPEDYTTCANGNPTKCKVDFQKIGKFKHLVDNTIFYQNESDTEERIIVTDDKKETKDDFIYFHPNPALGHVSQKRFTMKKPWYVFWLKMKEFTSSIMNTSIRNEQRFLTTRISRDVTQENAFTPFEVRMSFLNDCPHAEAKNPWTKTFQAFNVSILFKGGYGISAGAVGTVPENMLTNGNLLEQVLRGSPGIAKSWSYTPFPSN